MTVQTLEQNPDIQNLLENAAELFEASQIVLKTPDGQARQEFTINRRREVTGKKRDWVVNFIIPEGYTRLSFAYSIKPGGSAGATVRWNTDNPLDASVFVHAWADAFSKVTVIVENVLAHKD